MLEAIFSIFTLSKGKIPPTLNLNNPIKEASNLDLVPNKAIEHSVNCVLSNSFGFGGTNASLIFKSI